MQGPGGSRDLVPICAKNNVAVIARVVLEMGALTGFLTEDMQKASESYLVMSETHQASRRASIARALRLSARGIGTGLIPRGTFACIPMTCCLSSA
jgi:aryl-alcohol dehydrogenase-like predicted oxidoreductase